MKHLLIIILLLAITGQVLSQETTDQIAVDVESILEKISEPRFLKNEFDISTGDASGMDWNDYINQQIDACTEAGGGRVILAGGTYFCKGPIILRSNVNLHLEREARLVFSQEPAHYLPVVLVRWEGTEAYH